MAKPFRCRLSFMGMPPEDGTAVLEDQFLRFTSKDGKRVVMINRPMMREVVATYRDDGIVEIANVQKE